MPSILVKVYLYTLIRVMDHWLLKTICSTLYGAVVYGLFEGELVDWFQVGGSWKKCHHAVVV